MIESKILTVTQSASGKKYTNFIQIKGEWLKKCGFNLGDLVKVTANKNQIVIEKNVSTVLLQKMGDKNPALLDMIEKLGVVPID